MVLYVVVGGLFGEADSQSRNPFAKNPGVNGAISDPPPDLKLKPPMRGEVDKNDRGRNKQYDSFLPNWNKPQNSLSKGDIMKSKGGQW